MQLQFVSNGLFPFVFAAIGTDRTNRIDLAMSVDWGRPEVRA
jgi:hypothetical protein